ncbi:hypothetical protein OG196_32170 [Kitasatospora purpeofusca]|uniref:hypothetical protein n=1 Tax=Kitasatospora purpeofusca TaxID=67352 RepID=UPI002E146985|nr:hypothetical protein OG196_32170 [Kitasatospora purpeofusca]
MKALPPSIPPARRELAQAVRTLLGAAGGSLRSVAGQIHSSRSVLNRLASGKVLFPDADTVLKLHRLAECKANAGVVAVADLERLVQRVSDEYESAAAETGSAAVAGPAADTVASTRGGAPAALAGGTGVTSAAPVPPAGGDRRNGSAADLQWPVDELALHLDSGRYEHAVGMLDYAGDEAPAVESAAAIQACRSWDLAEAADTLLRKVGNRPEGVVLAVVGHLMDAGNLADARALISCSAQAA